MLYLSKQVIISPPVHQILKAGMPFFYLYVSNIEHNGWHLVGTQYLMNE